MLSSLFSKLLPQAKVSVAPSTYEFSIRIYDDSVNILF